MKYSIKELTTHLSDTLAETITDPEQRWFEIELIVGHTLNVDRTWVALHPDTSLTEPQVQAVSELVERRLALEPLAYLFNQAPFFGYTFFVDRRTLIPRPETEQLVQRGLDSIGSAQNWVVLDVGTGSGCIALSIANARPQIPVLASDRSEAALAVAQENARRMGVQNVTFTQGSLLTPKITRWLTQHADKHWLITANLPYLPETDADTMQKQVTEYEPHSALFAPGDGLQLIIELLNQLHPLLFQRTGDIVLLEHDPRQAEAIHTIAKTRFLHTTISTELDQNGAKRFTALKT